MSKRTLPPILKTNTSISPISDSTSRKSFITCSSSRASEPKGWTLPPFPVISATRCFSLSALRRVTTAVKPSRAKRRAMAPPVASPAPITTQTLSLAMAVLLPIQSVDGTESAQGRLSHGRLSGGGRNEAGAPADLGRLQPFAVRTPARRGEQVHPDFARRARRPQVLQKADPGLEVDDQDVVRRLGMRNQAVVAARVVALGDVVAEQPVEHDQHAAIVGVEIFRIARVMDPVARRRVEHVFEPAEPGDPVGMQPELIEQVQEQGRQHDAGREAQEDQRREEDGRSE